MSAGNITLSDNIQNYKMLRIHFKIEYTSAYYVNALVNIVNGYTQAIKVKTINDAGTLLFIRGVGISTGKSLNIENGFYTGASGSQPTIYTGALIPVRVFGMK